MVLLSIYNIKKEIDKIDYGGIKIKIKKKCTKRKYNILKYIIQGLCWFLFLKNIIKNNF